MSEIIHRIIEHERAYQIKSGNASHDAEHDIYDWYQILEYYVSAGRHAALIKLAKADEGAGEHALANIRKIAAVCYTALEHLGCPEREGYELRPTDANARPHADWSQAPAEAMHWAAGADGSANWFANDPHILGGFWTDEGKWWIADDVNIPIGIDWRTLKEKRPEVNDGNQAAA